jgi:hypothetical protein
MANPEITILLDSDGNYYCVPGVTREGGIWLSVATFPKPVGQEWRYPNSFGVAIMRGRDYVRRFTRMRLVAGRTETTTADASLVEDWRDASWWSPGLDEAWSELDGRLEGSSRKATPGWKEEDGASG